MQPVLCVFDLILCRCLYTVLYWYLSFLFCPDLPLVCCNLSSPPGGSGKQNFSWGSGKYIRILRSTAPWASEKKSQHCSLGYFIIAFAIRDHTRPGHTTARYINTRIILRCGCIQRAVYSRPYLGHLLLALSSPPYPEHTIVL